MKWFLKCLKNYATFTGRARRTEYWMFILFRALLLIPLILLAMIHFSLIALVILYLIVLVIPQLAVTVRRLHDTNNSGWYYFLNLIPIVGPIWFFVLLIYDGDEGENAYGLDPKEENCQ